MKKLLIGLGVVVLVLAIVGFAGWYFLLRVDTKPKAAIKETTASTVPGETADGTYSVVSGAGTFLGYRAQEVIFGRNQTPTGRTPDVTGTMTIKGSTISAVEVTGDLTKLSTGEPRRDTRAQSALDTASFPNARFVLAEPIVLETPPVAGKKIQATAVGDLTVKHTTRRVSIPLTAFWDGKTVQVAATPDVKFSDYDVDVGSFEPVATVQDAGQIDLQLAFTKA